MADGAPLCTTCGRHLAERLREVPDLLDDLLVTLSRQDRLSAGGTGGRGAEQPAPRLDVSRALHALVGEVTTWAWNLADIHRLQIPAPGRLGQDVRLHAAAVAADWLADHVNLLRTHPAALEAHHALTDAITQARQRADRPVDRTRIAVGPCPVLIENDQHCPGQVWAHVPTDDQRQSAELRCRTCGTRWDTTQWRRAGLRIAARRQQLGD